MVIRSYNNSKKVTTDWGDRKFLALLPNFTANFLWLSRFPESNAPILPSFKAPCVGRSIGLSVCWSVGIQKILKNKRNEVSWQWGPSSIFKWQNLFGNFFQCIGSDAISKKVSSRLTSWCLLKIWSIWSVGLCSIRRLWPGLDFIQQLCKSAIVSYSFKI